MELAQMERTMGDVSQPERVLIVDDHSLIRDGLRSIFVDTYPNCQILEADSLETALETLSHSSDVDLVLLDVNMPNVSRLSGLQQLLEQFPSSPVVMVSGVLDRRIVHDALAAGAAGFVPKSLKRSAIVEALEHVMAGEIYVPELEGEDSALQEEDAIRTKIESLTPQQKVVLGHLVDGKLNKQIAHELDVSMTTVKAHVSAILQKLNVFSRTQAVILANKVGFGEEG